MLLHLDYLSISKRDADCYDVCYRAGIRTPLETGEKRVAEGRVAAIRSDFTEDKDNRYERTMIPGTWRIRYEHQYEGEDRFPRDTPEAIEKLRFGSVHEAFAFYCSQVLA